MKREQIPNCSADHRV